MPNVFLWFVIALPAILLGYGFFKIQIAGDLLYWTAEPGKYLVHFTGQWAIGFLLMTFAITPMRKIGWVNWVVYRRRLGLAAFAYAVLHLACYAVMMLGLDLNILVDDFAKRPYIFAGMLALAGMLPMAVTSTKGWQRRLKRKWKVLHKLMYVVVVLVVVHLWWQVRQDFALALMVTLTALLLGLLRFKSKAA